MTASSLGCFDLTYRFSLQPSFITTNFQAPATGLWPRSEAAVYAGDDLTKWRKAQPAWLE